MFIYPSVPLILSVLPFQACPRCPCLSVTSIFPRQNCSLSWVFLALCTDLCYGFYPTALHYSCVLVPPWSPASVFPTPSVAPGTEWGLNECTQNWTGLRLTLASKIQPRLSLASSPVIFINCMRCRETDTYTCPLEVVSRFLVYSQLLTRIPVGVTWIPATWTLFLTAPGKQQFSIVFL